MTINKLQIRVVPQDPQDPKPLLTAEEAKVVHRIFDKMGIEPDKFERLLGIGLLAYSAHENCYDGDRERILQIYKGFSDLFLDLKKMDEI